MIRTLVDVEQMPVTTFKPVAIDNLDLFNHTLSTSYTTTEIPAYTLFYSPYNEVLDNVVSEAAKSLGLNYSGFEDAAALETGVIASNAFAGVEFDQSWSGLKELPEKFKYTLRFPGELRSATGIFFNWLTMRLFPVLDTIGPRNDDNDDGGTPVGYLAEGFLPIQHALSMSYIRQKSGQDELPEVVMQRYPYPKYIFDPLLEAMGAMVSLIIMLSFIYPATTITRYITMEKEKQLKEVMKIMGLSNWLHWTAWFAKSFIMLMISAIIICALMLIPWRRGIAVLNHASFTPLVFFMMVYIIATICFCFMIAPIFSKASTAAAVTGLLWFISYMPFSLTMQQYPTMTTVEKLGWCLLSNTGLGYGMKLILQYESTGEGFHWSNMFTPVSIDDELTVGYTMLMMLIGSGIYMCICLYVEQVFPGDFGVPRKWYFPFTREFWCPPRRVSDLEDLPNANGQTNKKSFEAEPDDKPIGLQMRNLKKKFGNKMVVKGLSINMFEDEITVLLGHNGAGKTTTISMLTGMFPPTSGTAIINGSDIRTNIEGARMSLGVCPQHNVLFDDMSVGNHIRFFSRIKGLKGAAVEREVTKYLEMIQLLNKSKSPSANLSGGMKRKLSICCALCGDTKVVLCDEPSSGMDPAARRQLWDLLQKEKVGRTLLLTTHFMDEADVLGDRIAIMCDGELKCYGTSFFLKKHYGSGYSLICVKEENCDPAEVTALLAKYIPGIQPKSNIGAELSYSLPDRHADQFEKMFGALEERSKELHLSGYGIGITSLEEVFMKVGADTDANGKRIDGGALMQGESGYPEDDTESMQSNRAFTDQRENLRGMKLTLNQWNAMMLKKILYTWRNKLLFLIQNLMPVFFILITVLIARAQSTYGLLPAMEVSRKQYPATVTVMERGSSLKAGSISAEVADQYEKMAKSLGGSHAYESTGNKNFTEYMLDIGETIQARIDRRYVAAASIEDDKVTAWLNNKPLHTAPLTVNMVHNAIARAYVGNDANIDIVNHPYPYTPTTIINQVKVGNNLGTSMATNLCFCMCFLSAMYILFLIKERQSRAKLLQFVSGVRAWTFWLTQYIWDYFTFVITCVIIILTILCFQENHFTQFDELARYFLILIVFCFAVLPYTYLISFLFKEPATGFARNSIFNILAGLALFVVVLVMSLEALDTNETAKKISLVVRVIPHFSLASGLNKAYTYKVTQAACEKVNSLPPILVCELVPQCCNVAPFFGFKYPGVLFELTYMVITGVVCFIVLIIGEMGLINELIYLLRKRTIKAPPPPANVDDDVERERQRILNMNPDEVAAKNLVLNRVTKYYDNFLAVNQVSLCVGAVECFGLLGVNGAGKTTTFKMMTGDEKISWGTAYVQGLNLEKDMREVYTRIGYCPQFDALLDDLTGREVLRIFCLLRGVQRPYIKQVSEDLAKSFGFMKHIDKKTRTYSGGNKRKLSTAIAVIGSPAVIYLDEPTTGMDPAARRQLWNMVCRIRDSGKSIVLTSHSMEECEALCTRLAIMVNGEFKCIGSTQHLKNKFSKGIILKIKVRRTKDAIRFSQLSASSRYRTQDSEDSMPSTPVPYQNTSNVSLRRSLESIKHPHSNAISDDLMLTPLPNGDSIEEVSPVRRRQSDDIPGFSGQKAEENIDIVKEFVHHKFPEAILQEEYQGMLTYYIPLAGIKWSKIFGLMEQNRHDLNIEDYSISQTTLEEIFLDFAKHQLEDPRTSHMKKLKKQEEQQKRRERKKKGKQVIIPNEKEPQQSSRKADRIYFHDIYLRPI
ncbi:hypothetical protein ACLKA6_009151 [Drosophila palustris]